ncbi:WD40 repeat-like protein [Dentipellis sp. KUC8613]|nr:WD40 repeat-like protein [Dentipellis sp. KUC8613]
MRTRHVAHAVPAFPVYSSAFLGPYDLVLGGGGGASRSGIKNKLRLYRLDEILQMKLVDELELERGEDAPMSMAAWADGAMVVCGINSPEDKMGKGENQNCRVYEVNDNKLALLSSISTLKSNDLEDYQRVTVLSPDANYLAVAGTHDLALLTFPGLEVATTRIEQGEIYDVAFDASTFIVATTINLLIYSLAQPEKTDSSEKGKQKQDPHVNLEIVRTIQRPKLPGGDAEGSFRAARFNPTNPRIFYTIINATPPRKRGAKSAPRRSYIARWNTETWKVDRMRKLGDKGVTVFDVSPNGKWIAYGSSDCTIGLLDAQTLAPLLSILKSHEFPPTVLRFNPTSSLLVSGSADSTVRIISIPPELGDASWGTYYAILMAVFIILFAIAVQLVINGTI